MKRLLTILFTTFLALTAVFSSACGEEPQDPTTLRFYAPDGAPALAISKFINDGENFVENVTMEYNVVSSGDIAGVMQQCLGDLVVMPINAASKLYKPSQLVSYKMVSVITHGNLYVMASNDFDFSNPLGTVIGVIGQGLVPDLTLKAVLTKLGFGDKITVGDTAIPTKVTLRYFSQASDMIPLLKQGVLSVGLLPEPAATNLVKVANNKTWNRIDLQELYDTESKSYPQAVLMVKESIITHFPDLITELANKFSENVTWVKENTTLAVEAVNSKLATGVTPSLVATNITSEVVDNCKIYWESSADAKQSAIDYINAVIQVGTGMQVPPAKALEDDFFN
ncbi:MAG: hypothetical protein J6R83_00620 [Clostridia bacterium]|nr:hypothetical protein [Clostridia bacterium]